MGHSIENMIQVTGHHLCTKYILGVQNCISGERVQGRIQDLKLGVAQMDWKIWKPGMGMGMGVGYFIIFYQIYLFYTG